MRLSPRALARASSRRPWRTIAMSLLALVVAGTITSRLLGDALTTNVDLLNNPEAKRPRPCSRNGCGVPSATPRW